MHVYDILMLTIVVAAAIHGGMKGLAWQLTSLASIIVSYLVALKASGPLAHYFGDQAPWNGYMAMLVVFLTVSLCIWVAFRLMAGMIDKLHLKEYDRQMGALFGGVKGVVWCLVLTFFAVAMSPGARQEITSAKSGHYAAVIMDRAHPIMPDGVHDLIGPYIHELDETIPPEDRIAHHGDHDTHRH